jgi:hypothetical protein
MAGVIDDQMVREMRNRDEVGHIAAIREAATEICDAGLSPD